MKKVMLVFGSVPLDKGGKQTHGLARGVFDLHQAIHRFSHDITPCFAATDIRVQQKSIDGMVVFGWNYKILFSFLIRKFYMVPKIIYFTFFFKLLGSTEKICAILFKLIFYNYALDRVKPDIVHLHGCYDALYSRALSISVFKVLRIHGINGDAPSVKDYRSIRKIEYYITNNVSFDFVNFVSTENMHRWKNLYGAFKCRTEVILNGFNNSIFYPSFNNLNNSNKIVLITIGTVSDLKGQLRVLEAISLLNNKNDFKYYIIGNNFDGNEYIFSRFLEQYNIDCIRIGYTSQKELLMYLHKSDYFILPSNSEGFGKVFIESIASGTPIILPKLLPIALEKGILTLENSIFIDDSTTDAIFKVLNKLRKPTFNRYIVSKSVAHLTWENIAIPYSHLISMLSFKED